MVWIVIWRVRFTMLETVFGLMGLAMIVVVVAAVCSSHPTGSTLLAPGVHTRRVPPARAIPTYFYYAIALFGAAMTPVRGVLLLVRRGRGEVDRGRTSC